MCLESAATYEQRVENGKEDSDEEMAAKTEQRRTFRLGMLTVSVGADLQLGHYGVLCRCQAAGVLRLDARGSLRCCVECGGPAAGSAHKAEPHAGNVGQLARHRLSGDVALPQTGDEHLVRDGFGDGVDEDGLGFRDQGLYLRLLDDRHLGPVWKGLKEVLKVEELPRLVVAAQKPGVDA